MEDGKIVELFLSRDESAISETAEKYGVRLRTLARGMVQSDETAEECENDTYWEAWRAIPPHEPCGYLYPFLARITRHLALELLSRPKAAQAHCAYRGTYCGAAAVHPGKSDGGHRRRNGAA